MFNLVNYLVTIKSQKSQIKCEIMIDRTLFIHIKVNYITLNM